MPFFADEFLPGATYNRPVEHHDALMRRALELAAQGRYTTSPNPRVGCVIVRDEHILGEGWHERAGGPHAEIAALNDCGGDARGATMYVTLEPCAHHGRTSPCVEAVIASGVKRLVVAMEDPNPQVAGRGLERLRKAGIEVVTGPGAEEAERLNEEWLTAMRMGRPYVILKAGLTLDGKLATVGRQSRWITSEAARQRSLELREDVDAILVGAGTITADDPQLTRRIGRNTSRQPWRRIVLDSPDGIPLQSRVITDGERTTIFTTNPARYPIHENLELIPASADAETIDLDFVLNELARLEVRSLVVEGGELVHAAFLERRLFDRLELFIAPLIVGGADAPSMFSLAGIPELTAAIRVRFDRVETLGPDVHIIARPVRNLCSQD